MTPIFFLGKLYVQRPPLYFFPAVILLKVPLGLMALSLAGIVLFFVQRTWPGKEPLLVLLLFGALLLAMLMKGTSSYAGMRHALIVLLSLPIAGDAALSIARERRWRTSFPGFAVATLLLYLPFLCCVPGSITTN